MAAVGVMVCVEQTFGAREGTKFLKVETWSYTTFAAAGATGSCHADREAEGYKKATYYLHEDDTAWHTTDNPGIITMLTELRMCVQVAKNKIHYGAMAADATSCTGVTMGTEITACTDITAVKRAVTVTSDSTYPVVAARTKHIEVEKFDQATCTVAAGAAGDGKQYWILDPEGFDCITKNNRFFKPTGKQITIAGNKDIQVLEYTDNTCATEKLGLKDALQKEQCEVIGTQRVKLLVGQVAATLTKKNVVIKTYTAAGCTAAVESAEYRLHRPAAADKHICTYVTELDAGFEVASDGAVIFFPEPVLKKSKTTYDKDAANANRGEACVTGTLNKAPITLSTTTCTKVSSTMWAKVGGALLDEYEPSKGKFKGTYVKKYDSKACASYPVDGEAYTVLRPSVFQCSGPAATAGAHYFTRFQSCTNNAAANVVLKTYDSLDTTCAGTPLTGVNTVTESSGVCHVRGDYAEQVFCGTLKDLKIETYTQADCPPNSKAAEYRVNLAPSDVCTYVKELGVGITAKPDATITTHVVAANAAITGNNACTAPASAPVVADTCTQLGSLYIKTKGMATVAADQASVTGLFIKKYYANDGACPSNPDNGYSYTILNPTSMSPALLQCSAQNTIYTKPTGVCDTSSKIVLKQYTDAACTTLDSTTPGPATSGTCYATGTGVGHKAEETFCGTAAKTRADKDLSIKSYTKINCPAESEAAEYRLHRPAGTTVTDTICTYVEEMGAFIKIGGTGVLTVYKEKTQFDAGCAASATANTVLNAGTTCTKVKDNLWIKADGQKSAPTASTVKGSFIHKYVDTTSCPLMPQDGMSYYVLRPDHFICKTAGGNAKATKSCNLAGKVVLQTYGTSTCDQAATGTGVADSGTCHSLAGTAPLHGTSEKIFCGTLRDLKIESYLQAGCPAASKSSEFRVNHPATGGAAICTHVSELSAGVNVKADGTVELHKGETQCTAAKYTKVKQAECTEAVAGKWIKVVDTNVLPPASTTEDGLYIQKFSSGTDCASNPADGVSYMVLNPDPKTLGFTCERIGSTAEYQKPDGKCDVNNKIVLKKYTSATCTGAGIAVAGSSLTCFKTGATTHSKTFCGSKLTRHSKDLRIATFTATGCKVDSEASEFRLHHPVLAGAATICTHVEEMEAGVQVDGNSAVKVFKGKSACTGGGGEAAATNVCVQVKPGMWIKNLGPEATAFDSKTVKGTYIQKYLGTASCPHKPMDGMSYIVLRPNQFQCSTDGNVLNKVTYTKATNACNDAGKVVLKRYTTDACATLESNPDDVGDAGVCRIKGTTNAEKTFCGTSKDLVIKSYLQVTCVGESAAAVFRVNHPSSTTPVCTHVQEINSGVSVKSDGTFDVFPTKDCSGTTKTSFAAGVCRKVGDMWLKSGTTTTVTETVARTESNVEGLYMRKHTDSALCATNPSPGKSYLVAHPKPVCSGSTNGKYTKPGCDGQHKLVTKQYDDSKCETGEKILTTEDSGKCSKTGTTTAENLFCGKVQSSRSAHDMRIMSFTKEKCASDSEAAEFRVHHPSVKTQTICTYVSEIGKGVKVTGDGSIELFTDDQCAVALGKMTLADKICQKVGTTMWIKKIGQAKSPWSSATFQGMYVMKYLKTTACPYKPQDGKSYMVLNPDKLQCAKNAAAQFVKATGQCDLEKKVVLKTYGTATCSGDATASSVVSSGACHAVGSVAAEQVFCGHVTTTTTTTSSTSSTSTTTTSSSTTKPMVKLERKVVDGDTKNKMTTAAECTSFSSAKGCPTQMAQIIKAASGFSIPPEVVCSCVARRRLQDSGGLSASTLKSKYTVKLPKTEVVDLAKVKKGLEAVKPAKIVEAAKKSGVTIATPGATTASTPTAVVKKVPVPVTPSPTPRPTPPTSRPAPRPTGSTAITVATVAGAYQVVYKNADDCKLMAKGDGIVAQKEMIRDKMILGTAYDLGLLAVTQTCSRRLLEDRRLAGMTGATTYVVKISQSVGLNAAQVIKNLKASSLTPTDIHAAAKKKSVTIAVPTSVTITRVPYQVKKHSASSANTKSILVLFTLLVWSVW